MKTFKYDLGHDAGDTLTVGELIESLKDYPSDMPVFASWEGVKAFIDKENFSKEIVKSQSEKCECLFIDVNSYF